MFCSAWFATGGSAAHAQGDGRVPASSVYVRSGGRDPQPVRAAIIRQAAGAMPRGAAAIGMEKARERRMARRARERRD